jgi:hypothetical protein
MANVAVASNARFIPVPQMPVGIPFLWFTDNFPEGTLKCNGQTFSATEYPELAMKYPLLQLPDIRGVTPRGMDEGRGLNPDASGLPVGSYQADQFKAHTHYNGSTSGGSNVGGVSFAGNFSGMSTGSSGGTETRGKCVLCYWLVYARTMYYDLAVEGGNAYMLGGHQSNYYASKQDLTNALIIQEAWQTPTLLNGWVNYGSVYAPAGFYKDPLGIVHLRGGVKSGTIGLNVFTLPVGYRPAFDLVFVTSSNALQGQAVVKANGDIALMIGSSVSFYLDHISFRAEG